MCSASCKYYGNYVNLHYVILHITNKTLKMKPLSNPFVIGKYVNKDYFCDRVKESDPESFLSNFRGSLHFDTPSSSLEVKRSMSHTASRT